MMNPIFHERVQRGHSKLTRSQVALAQYIVGLRSSFGLAVLAHSHFRSIRSGVTLVESNWGMMPDLLVDIEPPDAMLAIGFPRYTRATLEVARYAKRRGCQVIAITDSILSPLAHTSDFVIQAKISGRDHQLFVGGALHGESPKVDPDPQNDRGRAQKIPFGPYINRLRYPPAFRKEMEK